PRRSYVGSADSAALGSARAGKVLGGGDFAAARLVPDAVRSFTAGRPLAIRNPLAVRPWQHVLEPLSGYLLLAERLHADRMFAQGWNFGPRTDESRSVEDIANLLVSHWGQGAHWAQDPADHPHEAATLKLDCTKARLELGWEPRLTVEQALEITTQWYLAHHRGEDLRALTERQIADYFA
ncbi:MAG: CDP-glucose 4,6-dehydratase, partial [Novosphingobium sp.]